MRFACSRLRVSNPRYRCTRTLMNCGLTVLWGGVCEKLRHKSNAARNIFCQGAGAGQATRAPCERSWGDSSDAKCSDLHYLWISLFAVSLASVVNLLCTLPYPPPRCSAVSQRL